MPTGRSFKPLRMRNKYSSDVLCHSSIATEDQKKKGQDWMARYLQYQSYGGAKHLQHADPADILLPGIAASLLRECADVDFGS